MPPNDLAPLGSTLSRQISHVIDENQSFLTSGKFQRATCLLQDAVVSYTNKEIFIQTL